MPPPCSASRTGDHDRAWSEESTRRRVPGVQIDARRVCRAEARPLRSHRRCRSPAPTRCCQPGVACRDTLGPEPCRSMARVLEGMGPRHRRSSAASAATRHEVSPAANHRPCRTVARPYMVTCAVLRPPRRAPGSLLHRGAKGTICVVRPRSVPAWTERLPKPAPLLHRCLSTDTHQSAVHRVRPCRQHPCTSRSGRGRCGWCQTPIDFRALLHRRVRSVSRRCQLPTPYTSMGFVPLRGLPRPPAA